MIQLSKLEQMLEGKKRQLHEVLMHGESMPLKEIAGMADDAFSTLVQVNSGLEEAADAGKMGGAGSQALQGLFKKRDVCSAYAHMVLGNCYFRMSGANDAVLARSKKGDLNAAVLEYSRAYERITIAKDVAVLIAEYEELPAVMTSVFLNWGNCHLMLGGGHSTLFGADITTAMQNPEKLSQGFGKGMTHFYDGIDVVTRAESTLPGSESFKPLRSELELAIFRATYLVTTLPGLKGGAEHAERLRKAGLSEKYSKFLEARTLEYLDFVATNSQN